MFILYIMTIIFFFAALTVRMDTKELIRRSDEIQKTLNKIIEKEKKNV